MLRTGRLPDCRFGVLAAVCLLGACASGAEKTVEEYLNQARCADRAGLVLDGAELQDAMARQYSDLKDCITEHGAIDASGCDAILVGDYCMVAVEKIRDPYCVKRTTEDTYKIDWPCSTGWDPTPMKVFEVNKPGVDAPAVLRGWAELSSSPYPSGTSKETELLVDFWSPRQDTYVTALMPRARAQAKGSRIVYPKATEFYDLLKDGKKHRVLLEAAYMDTDGRPWAWISWYLQEGWRSMSSEQMAAAQGAKKTAMDAWLNPGKTDYDLLQQCCNALDGAVLPPGKQGTAGGSYTGAAFVCGVSGPKVLSGDMTLASAKDGISAAARGLELPGDCR